MFGPFVIGQAPCCGEGAVVTGIPRPYLFQPWGAGATSSAYLPGNTVGSGRDTHGRSWWVLYPNNCTDCTTLSTVSIALTRVRVVDQHFRIAICSFSLTAAWLIPVTGPRKSPVLLFFVTTFLSREWVICAPAAFLGRGSHFRLPLWNQTLFPVTCGHHCRHRKVPSKVGRVDIQMRCRSLRAAPQLLATEQLLWFEKHGVLRKCCCAKAPSFGAAAATVV